MKRRPARSRSRENNAVRRMTRFATPAAAALVAGCLLSGSAAAQAGSAQEAARQIEAEFGVKALKSRTVNVDGRAAFEVTVMNPGGDFNEAFQVNRLVVDAATGRLISGFRHRAAGYRLPDPDPGGTLPTPRESPEN